MNENVKKYGKIIAWIVVPTLLIAFVYMVVYMRKKKIGLKQLPKELKNEFKSIDFKKKLGITNKENNPKIVLEKSDNDDLKDENQNKQIIETEKTEIKENPINKTEQYDIEN